MVNFCKTNIRQIRYFTSIVSLVLMVVSLGALAIKGLNLGLDFTGGMVTEVQVDQNLTSNQLRSFVVDELGEGATVTQSGEEGRWTIRYALPEEGQTAPDVASVLSQVSNEVSAVSNSMVGSQVGEDLINQGGLALLISILSILGYLCFRFEWRLASGSLLALAMMWLLCWVSSP